MLTELRMMPLVLCLLARPLFHICPRSNCGWKAVGGALESSSRTAFW